MKPRTHRPRTASFGGRLRTFGGVAVAAGSLLALSAPMSTFTASATAKQTSAKPASKGPKAFPVGIAQPDGVVTVKAKPIRIVSLSPTATEMLFSIGAGPQVIAVDEFSNYPANAPATKLSGFTPNVEAIVKYKPDLIIFSDRGDAVKALKKLKFPVLVMSAAQKLDDVYAQIEQLGAATGTRANAVKVVANMQTDIAKIVTSVPKRTIPLRAYHELDNTLYSITSKTFIGSVYSLLGITSIANAADKDGSGYPQLSAEYLVKVNPDVVFLADTKCCAQNPTTFGGRPGFGSLSAVVGGRVIELDDDIASRWGPRIVDFMKLVASKTTSMTGTPLPAGV